MFRAIGKVLRWIWSGLDGLRKVLHLVLLLVLFSLVVGLFSAPIPLVRDKSALVIDPHGPLVEQLTGDPVERALSKALRTEPKETLLRDVVDAIESAADDDRISSLYLDLGGLEGGGLAKLQEVAAAIDDFRASGKPVIAYGDYYEQNQYYLAAHADEIYLDPMGAAYVDGYDNYDLFVKDALDKLSVDVNIFRVGEYKSAVEIFSRNDMSPASREESVGWLGAAWNTYKSDVAAAREFEPDRLQSYADESAALLRKADGDLAKMALDAGLVTSLKGRLDVEDRLAQVTGEDEDTHSYIGVDFDSYLANVDSEQALTSKSKQKVAVIVASGDIVPGEELPGMIGADTLAGELRDAANDEEVKAVVLRIDSPGGSVFASDVIRREVEAVRKSGKPVVASMSSLAASGGYYIAMAADKIVASPATLTGSIGIFFMMPTFQRSLERLGVHTDGVGTTALAGEFRLDRPMSDLSKDLIQQTIERGYRDFVGDVAKARTMSYEAVDKVAQGRVWAGSDAKKVGLVDQLGGYEDAIDVAAGLAKLGDDYDVEYYDDDVSIGEALGLRVRIAVARVVAPLLPKSALPVVPKALAPLLKEVQRLERLRDPGNTYAYCLGCAID
ncbi:MAG TPA: signal peptide peptidase SppA [Steroidobacteraceae bacterium]|nr:signal peptide peptidase SppA [Steroidobacteraceae bacterium]